MRNQVKRIAAYLFLVLLLVVPVSDILVAEESSLQSTTPDPAPGDKVPNGAYRKAAENDKLILYVNPSTLGIKVANRETGYVWNGALDEKDEKLNQTWQAFFESGLTVEYMDERRKIVLAPVSSAKSDIVVENTHNGFSADIVYEELGFHLKLNVRLTDDAVEWYVPASAIEETNDKTRLQSLYLYPFFGATKGIQSGKGYMLIPDGSGALIGLNEPTIASQPYIGRIYGDDMGMMGSLPKSQDNSLPPQQIHLPAYGIAHKEGGDAFVSLISGGAAYAEIRSYPSGVTTAYNWTTPKWIYREPYFQPVNNKGKGINLNQEERNEFDAIAKIMLLSGDKADYSGMAGRLRHELVQRGELPGAKQGGEPALPLRLEIVAAENEKRLIGDSVIAMTTVDELDRMLADLQANQAERMMVVVRGWTKGGVTGASPTHFPFEKKVGSASRWQALVNKYENQGIPVYLYTDYISAIKSADGYGRDEIAKAINKQLMTMYDGYVELLQPAASMKLYQEEIPSFENYGINHIAIDSIGSKLFSVYYNHPSTREQSIKTYQSMLSGQEDRGFAIYQPNYYLWNQAERILDLPMGASRFMLETEEVPFLQLILKGHVDYYSPPLNFEANPQEALLRLIDYGSYPSWYLTWEDPVKLIDSGTSWLYTSQYSVWKDQIVKDYKTVAQVLESVEQAEFDKREQLQDGVFRNRYSNGTVIYLNYSRQTVTVDGFSIPSLGFHVRKGDRS